METGRRQRAPKTLVRDLKYPRGEVGSARSWEASEHIVPIPRGKRAYASYEHAFANNQYS